MKKFYITTSIPYANAPPHIGFAQEAVQADVLARYHRLLKKDVFYLTGTDEHGLKIKKAAQEAGKSPKEFADDISGKFRKLTKVLNISNNDFIRTTDEKRHLLSVKKVWSVLEKKGDIYKKKYKGYYCSGCEAFVTKKDLKKGKCPHHNQKPELVEEENYFFRLSKYLPRIKKKIEKDELKIIPKTRKNEVLGNIRAGFGDVSFSRDEKKYWGFFVPGDKSQIIYVWGDALLNYISALGYAENSEKFKKYWPADVHCLGKDILKFHALIWPAMLLSLRLPLPKTIFVHGFITVKGRKMSKSLGNVVDPFGCVEKYGADVLRYYLLREIPATEDGDFTYDKFEQRYNADLACGIGNLTSRVAKMAEKIFSGKVQPSGKIQNQNIRKAVKDAEKKYKKALEDFKFNESLRAVWDLIAFCDRYIEKERPWDNKNQKSRIKNQRVVSDLSLVLNNIADFLLPFLPETSDKIKKRVIPLFPRIC